MRKYQLPIFSDHKLLTLLRERDDIAAFEELYHRYWRKLIDIAFQRIKSKEAAEEIVQEVMISLFIRRAEIEISTSVEAWLKTALKYKVYNIYRSQQVHLTHLDEIFKRNSISPLRPDEQMTLKEIREQVREAALRLPEKCSQVFMLSRFEHRTHQEISEQLGISVNTVKRHLNRALTSLKSELGHDHSELLSVAVILLLTAILK